MRLWHIGVLLLAGLIVGIAFPYRFTNLFGNATLYVFLPALIFEAAWSLDLRVMRSAWKAIVVLAVPGVLVTAAVISVCVHYVGGFAWRSALLLGAILSATDPIAVIAIFRRLQVPLKLLTIVESESLLNDAMAVVIYRAIIAAAILAAGGSESAPWLAIWQGVLGVVFAVLSGLVLAFLASLLLRKSVAAPVQTAVTFAGSYGVYILCDRLNWAGIFAVLTFGIALRQLERTRISVTAARGVQVYWNLAALISNVALFFLIGAALDLRRLTHTIGAAAITLSAVFLSRVVVAYGLLRIARAGLQQAWLAVVRMAGIRGALSLALALATPAVFKEKSLIIDATFFVVVATILLGALTLNRRLAQLPLEPDV